MGHNELLNFILNPLLQWFEYIKINYKHCYIQLWKILFVRMIILANLIVFFGIAFILINPDIKTITSDFLTIGLAVAGMLIIKYISDTIYYTSYLFVDSEFEKKPFGGIINTFNKIKIKSLKYFLANLLLFLLIALPLLILIFFIEKQIETEDLTTPILLIGAFVYLILAAIIYGIFTQFWGYNLFIREMGVKDGLIASINMVKSKIIAVIAFNIIIFIIMSVVSIPSWIIENAFQIITNLTIYEIFNNFATGIVLLIAAFLCYMIFKSIFDALLLMFTLPPHYLFWKQFIQKNKPTKK